MTVNRATVYTIAFVLCEGVPSVRSEIFDIALSLLEPDASQNRFSVQIETDAGSCNDTSDATGQLDAQVELVFSPAGPVATLSGLKFVERVPGSVCFSDMRFNFLLGLLCAKTVGVTVTGKTAGPFGVVAEGVFAAQNHRIVLNGGALTVEGLVAATIDLGMDPIESTVTNGLPGSLLLSVAPVAGHVVRHTVSLTLPMAIDQSQNVGGQQVRVRGGGTLKAQGTFMRPQ